MYTNYISEENSGKAYFKIKYLEITSKKKTKNSRCNDCNSRRSKKNNEESRTKIRKSKKRKIKFSRTWKKENSGELCVLSIVTLFLKF